MNRGGINAALLFFCPRFSAKVRAMDMTSTQLYLRLLGYVKPYWRAFAISIIAMVLAAATEPLLPALLKPMLDGIVDKDDTIMRMVPLFILVIFFVRGVATFISTYTISWVGNKVVMDLREEIHKAIGEANAGDFAADDEIAAVKNKWGVHAG